MWQGSLPDPDAKLWKSLPVAAAGMSAAPQAAELTVWCALGCPAAMLLAMLEGPTQPFFSDLPWVLSYLHIVTSSEAEKAFLSTPPPESSLCLCLLWWRHEFLSPDEALFPAALMWGRLSTLIRTHGHHCLWRKSLSLPRYKDRAACSHCLKTIKWGSPLLLQEHGFYFLLFTSAVPRLATWMRKITAAMKQERNVPCGRTAKAASFIFAFTHPFFIAPSLSQSLCIFLSSSLSSL